MPRAGLGPDSVVARAADLADAEGFDALSLATLAERLGVRAPSLYKHVGGLGDLHRRLALVALRELGDVLRDAGVGLSRGAALAALGRAYRAYAAAHPGRYAATGRAPAAGDDELGAVAHRVTEVLLAVLRGYGLAGDELVHAARTVRSALHGFVVLEAGGGFGLPQDVDASYEALLALLDRGLSGPPAAPRG